MKIKNVWNHHPVNLFGDFLKLLPKVWFIIQLKPYNWVTGGKETLLMIYTPREFNWHSTSKMIGLEDDPFLSGPGNFLGVNSLLNFLGCNSYALNFSGYFEGGNDSPELKHLILGEFPTGGDEIDPDLIPQNNVRHQFHQLSPDFRILNRPLNSRALDLADILGGWAPRTCFHKLLVFVR